MIRAVIFDLDGTVTRPFLNFKQIRLELGVSLDRGSVLDQIASMSDEKRERALAILERHEEAAAVNAELNHGMALLLDYLSGHGLPAAVVTRNSEKSTSFVLEKLGLRFQRVITRDSGLPIKPDPAPVLAAVRGFGVDASEVLMAGDFIYDIQCGRSAGTMTCLVTNGRVPADDGGPDFVVSAPGKVVGVLQKLGHATRSGGDGGGEEGT